MTKIPVFTLTILSIALIIGVTSLAWPQSHPENIADKKDQRTIVHHKFKQDSFQTQVSHKGVFMTEKIHVKEKLDSFYSSLVDKNKASQYLSLIKTLAANENLSLSEKNEIAEKFFKKDFSYFDLSTISESSIFKVLNVGTLAVSYVDEIQKVSIPLESIVIEGDNAFVDLSYIDGQFDNGNLLSSEIVELTKKDGEWLISSFPGVG